MGEEEDENQIILLKSPPTLQERLKKIGEGFGMNSFKSLRYETRNPEEKKQIEDVLVSKLGKWKYSQDDISS